MNRIVTSLAIWCASVSQCYVRSGVYRALPFIVYKQHVGRRWGGLDDRAYGGLVVPTCRAGSVEVWLYSHADGLVEFGRKWVSYADEGQWIVTRAIVEAIQSGLSRVVHMSHMDLDCMLTMLWLLVLSGVLYLIFIW